MEHTLTFKTIYKSIVKLPETRLPNFVVLTGKNGSGKSHLLEAIRKDCVSSSLVSDNKVDVLLFDWNSIVPRDTGPFNPSHFQTNRSNWFTQLQIQQEQVLEEIQKNVIQLGVPSEYCTSIDKLRSLNVNDLKEKIINPENANRTIKKIEEIIATHGKSLFSKTARHINDDSLKKSLGKVANENPEAFFEKTESGFFNKNNTALWGEVDPFQQEFGRLFSTYRELLQQNTLLEKFSPTDENGPKYLNEEEFVEKYKEPPWDFVNRILTISKLDFQVDSPSLHELSAYEPKLTKISKNVEMRFGDLSSGEKVLMSFALCLYNASDNRQKNLFPKLLLLDEVDAPLHPSMVVSLLKTIKEVLVDRENISVILTTHSPSTVALAPDEALYEMNPEGPSIDKISKGRGISILTDGVPTLSVSIDGRRQIFVESKTDAIAYEKLYQIYKSILNDERSLTFIQVGNNNKDGVEVNAGCDQVKRIVNNLTKNGNITVFGLIDWDGKNHPSDRIFVLSHEIRDGLESLLLDPVLLAAAAIKECRKFCVDKGIINQGDRYTDIRNWSETKWQEVANHTQSLILTDEHQEFLKIKYNNGMSLTISKSYLYKDDHKLEDKVLSVFEFLKTRNNNPGGLINYMIDSVLGDYPELIPTDLLTTFKKMLNAELT